MAHAVEILPGLWMGNCIAARDRLFLQEKMIEGCVNCTAHAPPFRGWGGGGGGESDDADAGVQFQVRFDRVEALDQVCAWVHEHVLLTNVLVYCETGYHVSPIVMVAYLMKYGHMDLDAAVRAIRSEQSDALDDTVPWRDLLVPGP